MPNFVEFFRLYSVLLVAELLQFDLAFLSGKIHLALRIFMDILTSTQR
jgi:hypothetical protein